MGWLAFHSRSASAMVGHRLRARHGERHRIVKFPPAQGSQNVARIAASKAVEQDRPFAQAH
jgi:hypothetical protein